jgi:hypothetical protein
MVILGGFQKLIGVWIKLDGCWDEWVGKGSKMLEWNGIE